MSGVVKDPARVALKRLCDCNGTGDGSSCIDLRHHLCLSSYLPVFGDGVLGKGEKKESSAEVYPTRNAVWVTANIP